MAQLHGLVGGFLGEGADDAEVIVGIETDRGPWVAALAAAGYRYQVTVTGSGAAHAAGSPVAGSKPAPLRAARTSSAR